MKEKLILELDNEGVSIEGGASPNGISKMFVSLVNAMKEDLNFGTEEINDLVKEGLRKDIYNSKESTIVREEDLLKQLAELLKGDKDEGK